MASNETKIFVALLDEGVEAWRPVQAESLGADQYTILPQPYDRSTERWEFEPGDVVQCEMMELSDGPILAAKRKIKSS